MKLAATYAIASLIEETELTEDYIIPNPFDKRVATTVAEAVSHAAVRSGVSTIPFTHLKNRYFKNRKIPKPKLTGF